MTAEAVATVTAAAVGRLARVVSSLALVALGFLGYGTGFLVAWLSPTPVVVATGVVFVGAGIGLLLPSIDAALSDRVPVERRAGAFSLRNSATFLGRTTGPVVFATLAVAAGVGYPRLLLAAGVVAIGAAAATGWVARRS